MVTVTLKGSGELKSVVIDPSLLAPDEAEVLSGPDCRRPRRRQAAAGYGPGRGDEVHRRPLRRHARISEVLTASAGPEIERLIALLAKLPGLGPRSARRSALALLKKREQLLRPLAVAMAEAAESG